MIAPMNLVRLLFPRRLTVAGSDAEGFQLIYDAALDITWYDYVYRGSEMETYYDEWREIQAHPYDRYLSPSHGNPAAIAEWREASAWAQGLRTGGVIGWRLPTRSELSSLARLRSKGPFEFRPWGRFAGGTGAWTLYWSSDMTEGCNAYRVSLTNREESFCSIVQKGGIAMAVHTGRVESYHLGRGHQART